MVNPVIEVRYPLTFRLEVAKELGEHLKLRHSVVLIGMKRVGISNFLRFFLYHRDIVDTYIADTKKHLFIPVDLNDLVEREIYPFWILTLKRIADRVEKLTLGKEVKKKIETLFLDSIQSQDLFLTIDSVRKSLVTLGQEGFLPTLFLLRFDRLKDAVTPEFFANLQGLKDATNQNLAYVFTSFRSLDALSPTVFEKSSLSVFSHNMYIQPAEKDEMQAVFRTYKNRYRLAFSPSFEEALFEIVGGHIQYLQLALIFLHETERAIKDKSELFDCLVKDERIGLQSEELWESLESYEQTALTKINKKERILREEKEKARYLFDAGFVKRGIFSPLFGYYVKQRDGKIANHAADFTKKENLLFKFLEVNLNEVCEREKIIEAVWKEAETIGVSDWAIDRLVARVRNKLKLQKNPFEIQTVKTRGYKLVLAG